MTRLFIIALLFLNLNGCVPQPVVDKDKNRPTNGRRYALLNDVGPKSHREVPNINKIPDAIPKHEPKSKIGNPKTYTVFRKMYKVLPSSKGFVEHGKASWYGKKFHGHRTSNGEIYNMYGMTAAHKTLPLPTYARVTNLENGKSVIVKINDRGPFHDNRIIDLSYTAASKLGVLSKGTANVRVEALEPGSPKIHQKYLRVAIVNKEHHARELVVKLSKVAKNHPIVIKKRLATKNKTFHVHIGPIQDETTLNNLKAQLQASKILTNPIVTVLQP